MTYTEEVAEYVASLRYEALPASVIQAGKRVTMDLLGVIFPAAQYPPARIMNDYVRSLNDSPRATVIGTDIRASTANAALANGTMAAEMEQDDVHADGTHPSSVYVPALMAVAEDVDASGRDWITALVGAYDVGCRIGIALGLEQQYARGFHPTAVCGTFGAAAGAAYLLGLDSSAVNSALGLAGSQASGLLTWQMEPEHFAKSFQSGVPARAAVTASELASRGYVGAPNTLDGRFNAFDAFSLQHDFGKLTSELGSRFEIERTGYKFYAACRAIHTALDIVLDLQHELGFSSSDVGRIRVWLTPGITPMVDNNVLTTHNLQFILAAALVDGVITRAQTTPARRADPVLNELANRIILSPDPVLERRFQGRLMGPTRLELRLNDGRTFEAEREEARGSTSQPASDQDLEAKFLHMTTQAVSEDRAREIGACIQRLETLESIRELTKLLAVADGNSAMSLIRSNA